MFIEIFFKNLLFKTMSPFENQKLVLFYYIRDEGKIIIMAMYRKKLGKKCIINKNQTFQNYIHFQSYMLDHDKNIVKVEIICQV